MADGSDEKVGYRRPPKAHQFKKGQSGNPKGRPRRPLTNAEVIAKIRDERMPIVIGGKRMMVSPFEAVLRMAVYNAIKSARVVDVIRLFKFARDEGVDLSSDPGAESRIAAQAVVDKIFEIMDRSDDETLGLGKSPRPDTSGDPLEEK